MLYLGVEHPQGGVLLGDYHTGFTGTELAQYNRTLYGVKGTYHGPLVTDNQAASTNLVGFAAQARQLANHNELRGTGGSLYYLKDKRVIEGSEKVALEVRDKISGLTLSSQVLQEGIDYEIDYGAGRILFYKPVPSVWGMQTIISNELLDGNPVYVVADYEYEPGTNEHKGAYGARLIQGLGSGIQVGGTYVKEEKAVEDYVLMGADVNLGLGNYGKLGLEYAQSESEGIRGYISGNGGLDYTGLATSFAAEGSAYKVSLGSDIGTLFNKAGGDVTFNGYYQKVEAGFSSGGGSITQQGTNKLGTAINAQLTPIDRLLIRYDQQKLLDNGNSASQGQVGSAETQQLTLQWGHDRTPVRLTTEYRYQGADEPLFSSLLRDEGQQSVAGRLDYQANTRQSLFIEEQMMLTGKANNQTTIGSQTKLNDKISLGVSETMGVLGNATQITVSSQGDIKEPYITYQVSEDVQGKKNATTIFGEKIDLGTMKVYREERFQGRSGAEDGLYSGLFGADYALNRQWGISSAYERGEKPASSEERSTVRNGITYISSNQRWNWIGTYERGQVDNVQGEVESHDTATLGLTYVSHPKEGDTSKVKGYTKATGRVEYRLNDSGGVKKAGYLTANKLLYQLNEDISALLKGYLSRTKNESTHDIEAQFKEISIGVAYRPVKYDKYSLLGKVAYLEDQAPLAQGDFAVMKSGSVVTSLEGSVDLPKEFQIVEKLAWKRTSEDVAGQSEVKSDTYLIATRINYKLKSETTVLNDWRVGLEYRILIAELAEDRKAGFVIEMDRELQKYVYFGIGYNFTDFTDNLEEYNDDYKVSGFFVRLTAKY
jgi:hypothetical protein